MASSELGHYVRFDEALLEGSGSANDPFDTGLARRAPGNLDHLADQYAQHLVNWTSPTTSDYFTIDADTIADDTYYALWKSAPFDMALAHFLNADGVPELQTYRCRCRLRVGSNSGGTAARFKAVLAQQGAGEPELLEGEHLTPGPNATNQISVTTATSSWQAASGLIYLDETRVRRASADVATVDSIGGAPITVRWLRAQLVVFGQRDTSSASPRLFGVHLSQFYEPP
jgi:hypothetical protein